MEKDEALKIALEALEGLRQLLYVGRLEMHELNAIHKNHERALTVLRDVLKEKNTCQTHAT